MMRLLHVHGSPRGQRSRSDRIAARFLSRLADRGIPFEVEALNVWSVELPALDGPEIEARYAILNQQPASAEQEAAWARVQRCAEHFASFDAFLISTPMWNFGLPYRLKQYIDVITQPGALFTATPEGGVEGALDGKRAWLIATSAWAYEAPGGLSHLDFQVRYMRSWFAFVGLTDLQVIAAAPMFGPAEVVDAAQAVAFAEVERLADAV